jgi:glucose-1-phosphate thymidylyltransferase
MSCRGVLLAGGRGTRLEPLTRSVNKHLLPVYDKPLVYYPLSTLMLSGISEILVVTTAQSLDAFQVLLGDGSQWGLSLSYAVQEEPKGIPHVLLLAEEFLGDNSVCLVLGDNIFHADGLSRKLQGVARREAGATVFGYRVQDPQRYGVVSFDRQGRAVGIIEKPSEPQSNVAVTGLYYYDSRAVEFARQLTPSKRGELEISDLNRMYLDRGELEVEILGRGATWLDAGTQDSLLEAANFVRVLEQRQGLKIACPEEVAFRMGFISAAEARGLIESFGDSAYGNYLRATLAEETT